MRTTSLEPIRTPIRTWGVLSVLLLAAGCTDTSSGAPTPDAGTTMGETGTATFGGPGSSGAPDPTVDPPAGSTGTTGGDDVLDGSSDGGSNGGMCDPQAQDCPEGEKCTFYRDEANPGGANKCVPIMGNAQPGDPCMALDNDSDTCDLGTLCWGTEPDNATGSCIELCDTEEQCSTGDPCTITNGGTLPMCLPVCDPLAPVCPLGWACYDDWEFSDYWFCDRDKSERLGQHGDPCETINGCDPGLICAVADVVDSDTCIASGASGCCTPICDITDPIVCPGPGEDCISYYQGPPPPQFEDVGLCAIPQ